MASVADVCMPCPANVYVLVPAPTPAVQPSPPSVGAQVLNGYGPPNKTINIPDGNAGVYYDLNPGGATYKWDPTAKDWTA